MRRKRDAVRKYAEPSLAQKVAKERDRSIASASREFDHIATQVATHRAARQAIEKNRKLHTPTSWEELLEIEARFHETRDAREVSHRNDWAFDRLMDRARRTPNAKFTDPFRVDEFTLDKMQQDITTARDLTVAELHQDLEKATKNALQAFSSKLETLVSPPKPSQTNEEPPDRDGADTGNAIDIAGQKGEFEKRVAVLRDNSEVRIAQSLDTAETTLRTQARDTYAAILKKQFDSFLKETLADAKLAFKRQNFDPVNADRLFNEGKSVPFEDFDPDYLQTDMHLADQLINNTDLVADQTGALSYELRSYADGGGFAFERNWFEPGPEFTDAVDGLSRQEGQPHGA